MALPSAPDREAVLTPPAGAGAVLRPADVGKMRMTINWLQWLNALVQAVNEAAQAIGGTTGLVAQTAAIPITAIPVFAGANLPAGLYRLTWYLRITRAAGTSSSVALNLGWTDGAVALSNVGAAVTGNTTTTFQTGTVMVRVDNATNITYSTSYASVGAPSMQYSLDLTLEAVV